MAIIYHCPVCLRIIPGPTGASCPWCWKRTRYDALVMVAISLAILIALVFSGCATCPRPAAPPPRLVPPPITLQVPHYQLRPNPFWALPPSTTALVNAAQAADAVSAQGTDEARRIRELDAAFQLNALQSHLDQLKEP